MTPSPATEPSGRISRLLGHIERLGNKLPDPAMLFLLSLILVWVLSALLAGVEFNAVNPRDGEPLRVLNLLTPEALTSFLTNMVTIFTSFAPLGVVLVAMLGVGVADAAGFFNTSIKLLLGRTSTALLTPVVVLVGLISHSAVDAGYVLVIPLGGIIFYAAGRHPLAGIAAAFAGVSGGFSANPVPSAIDPLLQGFTLPAAQIVDATIQVNPLNNYYFTAASSLLIIGLGWIITDRIIEPRLNATAPVDADAEEAPDMASFSPREKRAFWAASGALVLGLVLLTLTLIPEGSAFRDPETGSLNSFSAPIMQSIVPLIFLLFLIPGVVYGFVAGTFKNSKDVVDAMTKAMQGMSYYIVMAFFCSLFIYAFSTSNLGTLLAVKGAAGLQALNLPGGVTIVGIIFLTAFVNLFVGSASAKWALLAPIFVPVLMQVGISPDLTQAAYRVGDSSSNIITPLMPYFPLVVVYCQRYVKSTGIGTLTSIMLPYSVAFLVAWSAFLLLYWAFGIPLGLGASFSYGG
ncbi:AbgT family transporter [Rubricoccus marinus]|uniref:Aminobenzoyl-glutamate transporter n=1 Tax=Rubricoccus marinus TaxID=716817 RepID=A0A259U1R8_9BACT|nr:AbgT family transporter [Rubricoccus marinus]OZC03797.1 aminobenzoyl-glutamate transporter [Rubricoccus marinus]